MPGPNRKSTPKEIVGSHGHRSHGPSILWPALYEHLRAKGYSKRKAAMISNGMWRKKHHLPPKSVKGTKGLVGINKTDLFSMCPELRDDPVTLSIVNAEAEERILSDQIAYRDQQQTQTEDNDVGTISKSDLPQAVRDYIDELEDRLGDKNETIVKLAADVDALTAERDEMVAKQLLEDSGNDEAVKAAIAKADPETAAVLSALHKELSSARTTVAKQHTAAQEATLVSKSASLPAIYVEPIRKDDGTVDPADKGLTTILKSAYDVSPEFGDRLFTVLKHANDRIEQSGLFSELGTAGARTTIAKSAEAAVAEIRKANPDMTEDEALAEFYSRDGNYESARPGQEV